jgi:hypothetical protein
MRTALVRLIDNMQMRRSFFAAVIVAAAVMATPSRGSAGGAQDAARKEGEAGLSLFAEERFDDAYDRFAKADSLFHAPTLVLYMARCRARSGKLRDAKALFEKLLAEPVPANASKAFKEAQADGRRELDRIIARLPTLTLEVHGASSAEVVVDGVSVAPNDRSALAVEPGSHKVEAIEGGRRANKTVNVAEGARQVVVLELPAATAPPPPPLVDTDAAKSSWLLPGVAFGAAGAGILIGSLTGAMSLSKTSDLKSRCVDGHCPIADQSEASSAQTLATVSTVSFVVGAAAAGLGVYFVVTRPKAPVQASVGLGALRVSGAF